MGISMILMNQVNCNVLEGGGIFGLATNALHTEAQAYLQGLQMGSPNASIILYFMYGFYQPRTYVTKQSQSHLDHLINQVMDS